MSIRNKTLQDILSAIGGGGSVIWGSITGTIADQTDLAAVAKTNDYDDLDNKPALSDNITGGLLSYNDAGTAGTPIVHTGGIDTILTNDELGDQTLKSLAPSGVTDIWDASSSEFFFTDLQVGDMVDIRLDILVTTSSPNQEINIDLELAQGGFDYRIHFDQAFFKTASIHPVSRFNGIYIGDANTLDNKGQFIFSSDDDATIIVNGWYCKLLLVGDRV